MFAKQKKKKESSKYYWRSFTFAYRNIGPSLRFGSGILSPYGCWILKCFLNTRPPLPL